MGSTSLQPGSAQQDCEQSYPPLPVLPKPGQMPRGTVLDQIWRSGQLTVGVDQNNYRWGFRDAATHTLEGFDVDMLRQVSYAIFGPTGDHLRTIVVPNADRITDLMHGGVRGTQPYPGTVDIVAETMTVNCERKKSVDFSSVYYLAGQEVLVRRGSAITSDAGMAGRRVCAAQKSTSLQNLANLNLQPPIRLVTAVNQTDCLVMLQQGQVDAVSTDDTILRGMAAQDPTLQLIGPAIQPEPYGMAISKNNKLLTQFVNAVLDKERCDGTWKALYKKWLDVYTPGVVPNPPGPPCRRGTS
ncbi:MAG: glutamate ABC transporter substrate-binding protein [Actinomycetes bacterium]